MGRYVVLLFSLLTVGFCYNVDKSTDRATLTILNYYLQRETWRRLSSDTKICSLVCECEKYQQINCSNQNLRNLLSEFDWTEVATLNITHMDLSGNHLTNVTIIPELPIQVLNLSHSMIYVVESNSFSNLEWLNTLDLSHNRLTSANLDPRAFDGHSKLKQYEPKLAGLRTLSLAYNHLDSLDPGLFEHIPYLTELDLSGNPFKILDQQTIMAMSKVPRLEVLHMRSCQITEFPDGSLQPFWSLQRLDISDNQLKAVPLDLQETMLLIHLNLNQNPIVKLEANSEEYPGFPRLYKLKELHMSYMPELRSIGPGAMAGLEYLEKLYMSFNPKLSMIDVLALARFDANNVSYSWPLLEELSLRSNKLSKVEPNLISQWGLLEKIDVSDNPYRCDCTTQWMVDVLSRIADLNGGNSSLMVCHEPAELRGYTMRHLRDMHHRMSCPDEKDGGVSIHTLISWFAGSLVMTVIALVIVSILVYRKCRSRRLRKRQQKRDTNTKLED